MAARIVLSFDNAIVREVELAKPVMVVGRHPDCDVVIEHPAVSGRHLLFRVVSRTVYVEDLASTNGTKVNGLSCNHQVVHHLDMIEVGRHKLHFFDDSMLTAGVASLEKTVLNEYERTMLASHLADAPRAREANVATGKSPAPIAPPAPPAPTARREEDELSRNHANSRDPTLRIGPARESVRTEVPTGCGASLALKVVQGERRGELIALDRANTMIGNAGGDTALVVKRGPSYFLARFSGERAPRLNRRELGPGTHPISPQDTIDVGGSSFQVVQVA